MTKFIHQIRDLVILPGTVVGILPGFFYKYSPEIIPGFWTIKLFAIVILCIGLILFFWSLYVFQTIANGTLAPWTSKKKFIVAGPYRCIRNPMILGVFLLLIAEGLMLQSFNILIWAAVFIVINILYINFHEEKFLAHKFGDTYLEYKSKVPAWIPKL